MGAPPPPSSGLFPFPASGGGSAGEPPPSILPRETEEGDQAKPGGGGAAPSPDLRRFVLAGARTALALPAWIVGFTFLGVGSLARDVGHPLGAALLSTLLVYAAPAQLILYTTLASGGLVVAAAIAVGFSAIRLFPMTMSIMPYLRRPDQPLAEQLLLAHPVAATIWIESMRRLPAMEPEGRIPYYCGFAGACSVVCLAMTALGYALVGALPLPLAAGLMFITPLYFTISMASAARLGADWLAIGLGIFLVPAVRLAVGTDFDILAAGLAAGTLAYGADRVRGARAGGAP